MFRSAWLIGTRIVEDGDVIGPTSSSARLSRKHSNRSASLGDQHISPNVFFTAIHHIHGFSSPGTFVVKRFEKNSLIMVPPAFPAIPMAALVKTSPIPRSAWG